MVRVRDAAVLLDHVPESFGECNGLAVCRYGADRESQVDLRAIGKIEGLSSSRPGDDERVGDRFSGWNIQIAQHGISMNG